MEKQIMHMNCPHCKVPSMFDMDQYWEGFRLFRCLQCWGLWTEDYVQEYWGLPKTPADAEWIRKYDEEQAKIDADTKEEDWSDPFVKKEEISNEVPV